VNDQDFLKTVSEIHSLSEEIQFKCFLIKTYVPLVSFVKQATFTEDSIEAFLYQQLDFQKIYNRLKSKEIQIY
jgi:hypothetical protein